MLPRATLLFLAASVFLAPNVLPVSALEYADSYGGNNLAGNADYAFQLPDVDQLSANFYLLFVVAPIIFIIAIRFPEKFDKTTARKPLAVFVGVVFVTGGMVAPVGMHFVPQYAYAEPASEPVYADSNTFNIFATSSSVNEKITNLYPDATLSNPTTPTQDEAAKQFLSEKYGTIDVLNQQSYPTVGGFWTVEFETHGTHDLMVTAINGTTLGELPDDVEFVSLRDGTGRTIQPKWSSDDTTMTFPNFSGSGIHSFKMQVHTEGEHHLKFQFGEDTAYANNFAYPASVIEINDITPNGPTLSDSDNFGVSVSAIGDLDGDGVTDIAAGAPDDSTGGTDRGAVHIMFMNSDGTVKNTVKIDSTTPNGPTLSDFDNFGSSVSAIGDLDGDGVTDIAAGASRDDAGGTDRGAVHIMFMNSDGTVKNTVKIDSTTANGPTLSNIDNFGTSVSAIGDLDGDGVTDIAAGANFDDAGGTDRGAVHIMFMNSDGTVKSTVKIDSTTANGPTLSDIDFFGTSVSAIGDLNGDGITDIAAGAIFDDAGGTDRGAVHIMFMNSDGTVKSTVEINDTTPNGPTLSDIDQFGTSVSAIGDLDGDGVTDIAAGAFDDAGGSNRGAVHIMVYEL